LKNDGQTILGADVTDGVITNWGSYNTHVTILALIGMRWVPQTLDDMPRLDFAYDDGTGLHVISRTGSALYSYPNTCGHPQLLRQPGSSADGVIWMSNDPSDSLHEVITVARYGQTWPEPPIYLGTVVAGSMALADMNGDGYPDLVFTQSNDHYAWVLHGQASGSMSYGQLSGTGADYAQLDLGTVHGTGTSAPLVAVGDLDGDGDQDLLFAGQVGCPGAAYVSFNGSTDDEKAETNKNAKAWMDGRIVWNDWSSGISGAGTLSFLPWSPGSGGPASTATNLHLTVWGGHTATGTIEPTPIYDNNSLSIAHAGNVLTLTQPTTYTPDYLVVCFNYVRFENAQLKYSFPSWVGTVPRSMNDGGSDGGDSGTDDGGSLTGGLERPPPPTCLSIPSS
jgi:hypothetical protein